MGDPCCAWSVTGGSGEEWRTTALSNPADGGSKSSYNCSTITCSNGVNPCTAESVGAGAAGVAVNTMTLFVSLVVAIGAVVMQHW